MAVTSAGVPGSTVPAGVLPGNAAPGAGAQEPFASGVGGPFGGELSAARPQLIRALNGRLLLGHIRDLGRPVLARGAGPYLRPVQAHRLGRARRRGAGGPVRTAGSAPAAPAVRRCWTRSGPKRVFILGLDVGAQYVRGALADLAGGIRARASVRSRASSVRGRVGELIGWPTGSGRGRAHPGRHHPDGHRQPRGLRPAPQRHGADRRAARVGPPSCARAAPRGVRALAGGGERRGRGGAGRARPRLRARGGQLRLRPAGNWYRMGLALPAASSSAVRTAWPVRSPTCRCRAGRVPIRRTPAGAVRWRRPRRRRPWSGPPGGRACGARSRPGGSSPRRPGGRSGRRRWWRRGPAGRPAAVRRGHRHRPRADRARRGHRAGARIRRRGASELRELAARHAGGERERAGHRGGRRWLPGRGTDLAWAQLTATVPAACRATAEPPGPDGRADGPGRLP